MIRFVYFDLDDTLLNHRRAERRGLADVCETHAERFAHVAVKDVQATYHAHSVPLWQQYADGAIDKETLKRLRFARTLSTLGVEGLDPEALNERYIACYARHWTFVDGARAAFHRIADRLPVGILTNGFAEVQHAKFAQFPELGARTAALIISEDVGYMKPDPRIFAHAAAHAGAPADAVLYVGDSYRSDVLGALGAGWRVAWYTPRDGATAPEDDRVFRFRRWGELVAHVLPAG